MLRVTTKAKKFRGIENKRVGTDTKEEKKKTRITTLMSDKFNLSAKSY